MGPQKINYLDSSTLGVSFLFDINWSLRHKHYDKVWDHHPHRDSPKTDPPEKQFFERPQAKATVFLFIPVDYQKTNTLI